MNKESTQRFHTVVVGGSQAGLAAGYCLQQKGIPFIILDGNEQIGDAWRKRWDSLELFTPAEYNNLPGMPFPAPQGHLPTKDEMADYLVAYAQRFALPVKLQTWVQSLTRKGRVYYLQTTRGRYKADNVIVATGAYQKQRIPDFAGTLNRDIQQVPSCQYRNPSQVGQGHVLVVGAGNSGAQIALDLAQAGRAVWLAGRDTGHMKRNILGKDIFWWLWRTVFRVRADSWLGRRLRKKLVGQGAALLDIGEEELANAGISRRPRITSVHEGKPQTADGQVLTPASIIWATGFEPDFSWIDLPVFEPSGFPKHQRGVVQEEPGLYFLGLPFLHRGNSSLIGGVGVDAMHLATTIAQAEKRAPSSILAEPNEEGQATATSTA